MTKLTVELPDELVNKFQQQGYEIKEILVEALENYFETKAVPITQTKTWELCGSFEVSEPEPQYIMDSDEESQVQTNYAENIDEVIY